MAQGTAARTHGKRARRRCRRGLGAASLLVLLHASSDIDWGAHIFKCACHWSAARKYVRPQSPPPTRLRSVSPNPTVERCLPVACEAWKSTRPLPNGRGLRSSTSILKGWHPTTESPVSDVWASPQTHESISLGTSEDAPGDAEIQHRLRNTQGPRVLAHTCFKQGMICEPRTRRGSQGRGRARVPQPLALTALSGPAFPCV